MSLEAFVQPRHLRPRKRQVKHVVVRINGHEVSVTEDDVGVVELHEN
jgi:hypothetical protein